jgi:hypothetical protein
MIKVSVDYKDFSVTLERTVNALESLKVRSHKLFDDNKINKRLEKIKRAIDQSIDKYIEDFHSQKFIFTYLQKFYQNRPIIGNFAFSKSKQSSRKEAFHKRYIIQISFKLWF